MKILMSIFILLSVSAAFAVEVCTDSADIEWTHCANEYGTGSPRDCSFVGLREMRFGNGVEWSYKKEFGGVLGYLCREDQFPDVAFSGGPYRCEYSDVILTADIDTPDNCNDRHDCNGFDGNVPSGAEPFLSARIKSSRDPSYGYSAGAFRTKCKVSHFSYDDPLVYPNQPGASHLHMFSGNDSVNAMSDPHNLANVGGSTCDGGILNRSAYWTPALLDMNTKRAVLPEDSIWYYKEGFRGLAGSDFVLPEGLGMIGREFYWTCDGGVYPTSKYPFM